MIQLSSQIVEKEVRKNKSTEKVEIRRTFCQIDVGDISVVSIADQFAKDADDRFLGQKAAFEKAVSKLPKQAREELWEQFKSRSKRSRKYYNI